MREYTAGPTWALCMITSKPVSAVMYGIRLVTAARLTSLLNCAAASGEMVDTAMSVCSTPQTIMPITGASLALTLLNSLRNRFWSAVIFAVWARVNCQPSSEPTHAMTARAMTMLPTSGLNILA
ncbi:hypothetical protein D9M68_896880 [compost metagenome]